MKVYIETQGCSLNHADSETMMGSLIANGYEIVETEEDADVILYNTCTVKNPTQDSFLSKLEKQTKPVVVAGCIPQADKQGMLNEYVQIGVGQLQQAPKAVEAAMAGKSLKILEDDKTEQRLNQNKMRINPHIEIIPICAGCLSNCTYCKTKQARGNLYSYRPMDIELQARKAIKEGVKEIWLTSQDNGAYGMDIKTNCAELLTRIANIEGDFMIRFGMTNPDWTKKWLEPLIQAYKHPRVYKFLHLPIQAGSDPVLKHMKRRCTAEDIRHIVKRFREEIPDITIATDIICGYPTETEEDFQATLDLVEELQFPIVHISKFYPRPDTPAANMDKLPTDVVKDRSRKMTSLFESELFAEQNNPLIGKTVRALFTEKRGNSFVGRTENYIPVIVHSKEDPRGNWKDVEILQATRDDIRGRIHNF